MLILQFTEICAFGWGEGIRTPEWQDQNLLPYRLATPQFSSGLVSAFAVALKSQSIFSTTHKILCPTNFTKQNPTNSLKQNPLSHKFFSLKSHEIIVKFRHKFSKI